jgi:hypothetical protein
MCQSMGNNDKQWFRITEQCVQDRQKTFSMCYRREHVAQCVEWFYKRREITAAWETQGLVFSQKVMELIKHRGDK